MHRRLCSKWRGASRAYIDAMSKMSRTSESAAVTAEPPARTLVQPALQSFKSFAPLDTVEHRSGRNVKKKTSIKSSGGSFKHKDFTVTNGMLDIHAAVKPNDSRHRKRAAILPLKRSNKQYKMKKSKMQPLLKDFPHLESVGSECGIAFLRCGACHDFVIDCKSKACPGHVKNTWALKSTRQVYSARLMLYHMKCLWSFVFRNS
jgi:hypothetical protein